MKKLLLIEILLTISFTLMAEDPAKTYKNPVVNYSLPDPSVIRAEGWILLFVCNGRYQEFTDSPF